MKPTLQQIETLINDAMGSFESGELFGSLHWEYRHFVGQYLGDKFPGLIEVVSVVVNDPWQKPVLIKLPIETPCIYMEGFAFDGERFVELEPLTDEARQKFGGKEWQHCPVVLKPISRSEMFRVSIPETERLRRIVDEGWVRMQAQELDTHTMDATKGSTRPRI